MGFLPFQLPLAETSKAVLTLQRSGENSYSEPLPLNKLEDNQHIYMAGPKFYQAVYRVSKNGFPAPLPIVQIICEIIRPILAVIFNQNNPAADDLLSPELKLNASTRWR